MPGPKPAADLAVAAELQTVDPPSLSELTVLRGFTSKANAKE